KIKMKIAPGTQTGKVFRLKGKGAPNVHGRGHGDQHVQVKVVTPTKLTDKQKDLLREFNEIGGNDSVDEQDTFFNRFKKAFKNDQITKSRNEWSKMKWLEVSIETTNEAIEPVSNILHEYEADGVSIEDPLELSKERDSIYGEIYELNPDEYLSEGVMVRAYYPELKVTEEMLQNLTKDIQKLQTFQIDIGKAKVT